LRRGAHGRDNDGAAPQETLEEHHGR